LQLKSLKSDYDGRKVLQMEPVFESWTYLRVATVLI
jgi:hypothetical protein